MYRCSPVSVPSPQLEPVQVPRLDLDLDLECIKPRRHIFFFFSGPASERADEQASRLKLSRSRLSTGIIAQVVEVTSHPIQGSLRLNLCFASIRTGRIRGFRSFSALPRRQVCLV